MKPLDVLRSLGEGEPPPARTKQRVYDAVITAMGAATVDAPPKIQASQPTSDPQVLPSKALLGRTIATKSVAVGAGIFLLGAAAGALLYGAVRPQDVRVVYVERPTTAVGASATPIASVGTPSSVMTVPPERGAPLKAPPAKEEPVQAAGPHAGSDLARERALLDVARTSAARGQPADVLVQVARHRQQFPHGRLSEEREALAIRALLSLGRQREARARMNAFRVAYPNSFLAPALEAAALAP